MLLRFKVVHIDRTRHRRCKELSAQNSAMAMDYMEQLYGEAVYMAVVYLPRGER